eukprot:15568039-Heterocapsa_arctica.AAC.1
MKTSSRRSSPFIETESKEIMNKLEDGLMETQETWSTPCLNSSRATTSSHTKMDDKVTHYEDEMVVST